MLVCPVITAQKLELDPHPLPAVLTNVAFGFTIRKSGLQSLHNEAQFVTDHAENINDALFVYWRVPQSTKVEGCPKHGTRLPYGGVIFSQ